MLRLLFLLLAITALLSCDTKPQQQTSTTPPKSTETTTINKDEFPIPIFTPTSFLEIDSLSSYVMYPLTWKRNSIEERGKSSFFSSSNSTGNYYHWNILFYNKKTKKSHLLHPKTNLFITDIIVKDIKQEEYNYSSSYGYETTRQYNTIQKGISQPSYIFYLVVTDDYDKNQLLEANNDPTYLYISDREGKNFRQVSPKNIHVREWKFISPTEILLYGLQDTNQDKDFDDDKFDRNAAFHITILSDSIKTDAIITDSLQMQLQKQFSEFYIKNLQPKEND
jgi:hypothetical protein